MNRTSVVVVAITTLVVTGVGFAGGKKKTKWDDTYVFNGGGGAGAIVCPHEGEVTIASGKLGLSIAARNPAWFTGKGHESFRSCFAEQASGPPSKGPKHGSSECSDLTTELGPPSLDLGVQQVKIGVDGKFAMTVKVVPAVPAAAVAAMTDTSDTKTLAALHELKIDGELKQDNDTSTRGAGKGRHGSLHIELVDDSSQYCDVDLVSKTFEFAERLPSHASPPSTKAPAATKCKSSFRACRGDGDCGKQEACVVGGRGHTSGPWTGGCACT